MADRAIIFDLDGTLIDSLADIAAAANRVLEDRGVVPHGVESYLTFIGDGAFTLMKRALPQDMRDETTVLQCLAAFREEYSQTYAVQTRLYPGIPELLDELVAHHFRLALLSNKPHAFTLKCAEAFLSPWPFEFVWGQREGMPRKPDPSAALAIADKMGFLPSRCLYVGDSGSDMQTACNAGMIPVGVLWGFRGATELKAGGAVHLISRPAQLLDVIKRIDIC